MTFLRTTLIGITALSLTGCMATAAQRTYNSYGETLSRYAATRAACFQEAESSNPAFKAVFEKNESGFTDKAKKNKSYISKSDKKDFGNVISELEKCREHHLNQIRTSSDPYVRSFANLVIEDKDLKSEVYKKYLEGKITGGQAATSLDNISVSLQAKADGHNQAIISQLNQQHFQEQQTQAAMWQAIGAGFQDYSNQQQQYQNTYNQQQQMNKTVYTQCRWNAGVMDCTSF